MMSIIPVQKLPLSSGTLALCLLMNGDGFAQTSESVALSRQTEDAFRTVLEQPQDLAAWSTYAELLVQAGNYEGGIAALERLLLDPQAKPNLRVKIATLYFRLGSYAMAESMARDALADNRLQGDERRFAETLLANTAKRNQRNQLNGAATLGVRHQTNPTYRTDSADTLSAGVLVPVAANQKPEADSDTSLALRLGHFYDLDTQNSAAIVSNVGAYIVDYQSSSGSIPVGANKPYDAQLFDLNSGLQFKPSPVDVPGLTVRPHVLFSNLVAQDQQYVMNSGLGLDLSWRPSEVTLYELSLDSQYRDFANRADVPNSGLQSGHYSGLSARMSREVGRGQVINGEYSLRSNRSARSYHDYDSHELRASYAITYGSPISSGTYWTTTFWLGALQRNYGGANPDVSPTETRVDRETRLGVNQLVPIAAAWSLVFSLEHSINESNLSNYRYSNTSLSGSVVRSF